VSYGKDGVTCPCTFVGPKPIHLRPRALQKIIHPPIPISLCHHHVDWSLHRNSKVGYE
jgi:hypothetical protein